MENLSGAGTTPQLRRCDCGRIATLRTQRVVTGGASTTYFHCEEHVLVSKAGGASEYRALGFPVDEGTIR